MSTRPLLYGGLPAPLETTPGGRLDHAPTGGRA
jgi:hypothetical protein